MSSNQDSPDVPSPSAASLEDLLRDCAGSEDFAAVIRALIVTRDPTAIRVVAAPLDSVGPVAQEKIVSLPTIGGTTAPDAVARPFGETAEAQASILRNENAAPAGIPDTTALVAHPNVVRSIRAALRRGRIAQQDMDDATADVQTEAIAAVRAQGTSLRLAQWKALVTTIATRWALDRRREANVRSKYDAGLCDDPDAYLRPTLRWEHTDPIDTKTYLAVLKELFDSGQMPEHGEEILQGVADEVPHEEIAAKIGVPTTVVHNRLARMRSKFRARLAALGMLAIVLLLLGALLWPMGPREVAAPRTTSPDSASPVGSVP